MKVSVFHHYMRAWPAPKNHMDVRVCPTCKVGVYGSDGQRDHHNSHLQEREFRLRLNGWLEEFAKRTGMTEEEFGGDWSWGAEVTGTEGELAASEDAEEG